MSMTLSVNGTDHEITADPQTPLLYVLRNDLRLNAAKFGCGLGQCGACTVVIDVLQRPHLGAEGPSRHHAGGSGDGGIAGPAAAGVHRYASRTMRLLHRRHDHARTCIIDQGTKPQRRPDPRFA
jgi:hypothetical protein